MVTVSVVLAVIALFLAIFSLLPVGSGYPLIPVAVILLALAMLI